MKWWNTPRLDLKLYVLKPADCQDTNCTDADAEGKSLPNPMKVDGCDGGVVGGGG